MTRTQFRRKYREIAATAHARLLEKADEALRSGAIDLDAFADDYALPKIVLTAALDSATYDWRPLEHRHREHVKNLKIFI